VRPIRLLLLLLFIGLPLAPASARAGDAEAAAQAQAMLGPYTWARAIVIHNPRRAGSLPARVHGTVFSFHGVLWLYTPREGTRSLSHRRGRLDLDRENLLPLLRAIRADYTGYEIVPVAKRPLADGRLPKLRNGCVVESLHALTRLLDRGIAPAEAGLFTVYVRGPGGLQGHTGLLYRTPDGVFFWDPDHPDAPLRVSGGFGDGERLAREVRADARWELVRTHFLPIDGDLREPERGGPVVHANGIGAAGTGTS